MKKAWVIRPYPHNLYRVKEFLAQNIVAIGWPGIGDLTQLNSDREKIKLLIGNYYTSPQSLGQAAGNINRFLFEIQKGDFAVMPDGSDIYIGIIASIYQYDSTKVSDDEGYCHQRKVDWLYGKKAIPRNLLTGRVYDSLKGRQTIFETYPDDIEEIIKTKKNYFSKHPHREIKVEYLRRLQSGLLKNVNSNTFEDAVCALYRKYFPGLRRLATTNSKKGDTDLLAELPGNVNVRIQVKHFYPSHGELESWVVDQLADSMEIGDHGIVITSGTISESAIIAADRMQEKRITFINGQVFVEHLFDTIDEMPKDILITFGVTNQIDFI
jgi:hypothetical protein